MTEPRDEIGQLYDAWGEVNEGDTGNRTTHRVTLPSGYEVTLYATPGEATALRQRGYQIEVLADDDPVRVLSDEELHADYLAKQETINAFHKRFRAVGKQKDRSNERLN